MPSTSVVPPSLTSGGGTSGEVASLPMGTARVVLSAAPDGTDVPDEPAVGRVFAGFRLVAELGSGAFARVFLARQDELAGRPMALKVAAGPATEPATLALLQHTNIVPVYSVHTAGRFHAVCMPYFGATTLADVLDAVKRAGGPPATGAHLAETLAARRREVALATGDEPADPPPHAAERLAWLGRRTHVDAVLWLAARLADGLDHAHARGVVHRDLKPANVLLTDDAQPMLLDFNLAVGAGAADGPRVGGTVTYMAPEHLRAFLGQGGAVDARSDLYSLGLVLFELLAGRAAHKFRPWPATKLAAGLLAERAAAPPRLRPLNPRVGPAVEALVLKLLAPDPAARYQSARDLREDIERHLADRPLRHAPNPSARERAGKWVRRHPRAASAGGVGGLAAVLLAGVGLALWAAAARERGHAAAAHLRQFRADKAALEAGLGAGLADPKSLPALVPAGWQAVDRFAARTDPDWQARPAVRDLPAADREAVRREVGELLLLTGIAAGKLASDPAASADAAASCEQAAGLLPDGPAAVARGVAARLRGRPVVELADPADPLAAHLLAFDRLLGGRFAEAEALAERATDAAPAARPAAWFVLGYARQLQGQMATAEAAYGAALALDPGGYWPRFNRGLARLHAGKPAAARADFDACVAAHPGHPDAWLSRAAVRHDGGDPDGALADLGAALAAGGDPSRVHLFRASLLRGLGRRDEAAAALAEALRHPPADADGWVSRGVGRAADDPTAALADFARALELDPGCGPALVNTANLLAERLGRPADAVRALDRLLADRPRDAAALGYRAVLRARQGERPAAQADAEAALAVSREPAVLVQVAGAYALTAAGHPADRAAALRLLAEGLQHGYAGDPAADPDLRPLHPDPEFRRLVAAARAGR